MPCHNEKIFSYRSPECKQNDLILVLSVRKATKIFPSFPDSQVSFLNDPAQSEGGLTKLVRGLDFAQPFRLPRVDPPIPRACPGLLSWCTFGARYLGREPDSVAGLVRALQESSATHRSSV